MSGQQAANISVLSDLATPWCVRVVSTLRIAEHIESGTTDIGGLALATASDSDSLLRVLRHLARKGLFEEPTPGSFHLTEAGRGLLDSAQHLSLDLMGFGGRMAYAWGNLLKVVKTGRPAYQELFGLPFWEDLDAHPDIAASFDALMGPLGHGTPDPEVLVGGDWDSVETVVDVGGGTGALLAEVLRARPGVRGTLVDLPRTTSRAAETFRAAGVSDRVGTVGQSFFSPLPAGADLYLLRNVLNDWPDREAKAILNRCAEAARPSGRVVVLGGVSPDEGYVELSPELVLMGGKERTLTEFRDLARAARLEVVVADLQPSGRFVVECRPI